MIMVKVRYWDGHARSDHTAVVSDPDNLSETIHAATSAIRASGRHPKRGHHIEIRGKNGVVIHPKLPLP